MLLLRKTLTVLTFSTLLAGCGSSFEWFPQEGMGDTTPPLVSSFVYNTENGNPAATIEKLIAADNVGVTGYLVTETATAPAAADSGWSATVPDTYTFADATGNVLYVWARDAAGNVSSAKSFAPVYTVQSTIDFPAGVLSVADIAYDNISGYYWLLASGTSGAAPNKLVKIDTNGDPSGVPLDMDGVQYSLDAVSSLAFDGTSFWISNSGYPQSEIYRFSQFGEFQGTYPCPATSTGFCQGLTWGGANLWAAGSDNMGLVSFKYDPVGKVLSEIVAYDNLWDSVGVSDAGFDSATGQLLVLKDGLISFDPVNGARIVNSFTLPGSGKGDWDGQYFWVIDNVSQTIKVLIVR